MNVKRLSKHWAITLAVLTVGVSCADDAVWNKTAAAAYDWTNVVNWLPATTFPNGAGQTAYITNDIAGAQFINLRKNITLGTLCVGDGAAASNLYNTAIQN